MGVVGVGVSDSGVDVSGSGGGDGVSVSVGVVVEKVVVEGACCRSGYINISKRNKVYN